MAITVKHEVLINRPVEDVFAYTVASEKVTSWQEGVVRIEADGPMRQGMVYTEVRKVMGREMAGEIECVAFDAPNSYTISARTGPVPFTFTQKCTAEGAGTRVSIEMEGEPGGFFGIAGPLLKKSIQKDIERDYARLKEILEA
jgi:uncharacterized protein YndB with AHSA1/START domain